MNKHFIIYLIFLLGFGCREKQVSLEKDHEIVIDNLLSLRVPKAMRFSSGAGIDSYIAYLINEKNDTFHIELGARGIIFDLYIPSPPVFPLQLKQGVSKRADTLPNSEEVIFSEYAKEDAEQKIFDQAYYLYDTINNIIAKIVQPKRIGRGLTGVYMPKLSNGKSFSMYANNLDSTSHMEALRLFHSIRYKD